MNFVIFWECLCERMAPIAKITAITFNYKREVHDFGLSKNSSRRKFLIWYTSKADWTSDEPD